MATVPRIRLRCAVAADRLVFVVVLDQLEHGERLTGIVLDLAE